MNTHFFLSSIGWMIADEPTVVTSGVFDSATKSSMASAAGVVVGPIRASTFCSVISFLTLVTALVGSDASSSTMYSTFWPPISVGSRATVCFCGMPTTAVGPVDEAMTPILMSAVARLLASIRARRVETLRRFKAISGTVGESANYKEGKLNPAEPKQMACDFSQAIWQVWWARTDLKRVFKNLCCANSRPQ